MSKTTQTLTKFRDMQQSELTAALGSVRDEAFRMKLGGFTNQVTSTAALRTKRRDVARILTILSARQRGVETVGGTAKAKAKKPAAKKTKG